MDYHQFSRNEPLRAATALAYTSDFYSQFANYPKYAASAENEARTFLEFEQRHIMEQYSVNESKLFLEPRAQKITGSILCPNTCILNLPQSTAEL